MSLYGVFDYLDILSSRSTTERNDEDENDDDEEEDLDVLVPEEATTVDTTWAESEHTTTIATSRTLPSEIQLSAAASSSLDTNSGLVILPSIPSEEAAAQALQSRPPQRHPPPFHSGRTTALSMSLSLHTTESEYIYPGVIPQQHPSPVVDQEPDYASVASPSSEVSSLSLSVVSTVPSTGFTQEIEFATNLQDDRASQASSTVSSDGSSSSSDDEASTSVQDVGDTAVSPGGTSPSSNHNHRKPWFARLETEQDWDVFRQQARTLMQAVQEEGEGGEDPPLTPQDMEAMISQLIAQEEALLYYSQNSTTATTCTATARKQTVWGLSYPTVVLAAVAGATLMVPLFLQMAVWPGTSRGNASPTADRRTR